MNYDLAMLWISIIAIALVWILFQVIRRPSDFLMVAPVIALLPPSGLGIDGFERPFHIYILLLFSVVVLLPAGRLSKAQVALTALAAAYLLDSVLRGNPVGAIRWLLPLVPVIAAASVARGLSPRNVCGLVGSGIVAGVILNVLIGIPTGTLLGTAEEGVGLVRLQGLAGAQLLGAAGFALVTVGLSEERGKRGTLFALTGGIISLLSVSRTFILAACIALVVASLVQRRGRLIIPLAAIFAGVAQVDNIRERIFIPGGGHRFQTGGLQGREVLWEYIWRSYVETHPWVGAGAGSMRDFFALLPIRTGAGDVHNEYLRLLAEVGFLGMIVAACVILSILFAARSAYVVWMPGVAGLAAACYSENVVSMAAVCFLPVVALVASHLSMAEDEDEDELVERPLAVAERRRAS